MSMATTIRELKQHPDETVALRGWVHAKRSSGKIIFLQVRDGTGVVQCIAEARNEALFAVASEVTHESSVRLTGSVRLDERAPGGCELALQSLAVVQQSEEYPISRKAHGIDFLFQHRHLWLRSPRQVTIQRIRHTVIQAIRDFFDDEGFTLVDTPLLGQGAAEGAGSLFPVDYFGEKAYLAQTGQLYLESACMALGKVYCFGPTFRAEKSKTRRHLTEFWMVEPEIAWAELEDLAGYAEALITRVVTRVLDRHRDELTALGRNVATLEQVTPPFPRLTYSDAVELLRSDETQADLQNHLVEELARLEALRTDLLALEARQHEATKAWKKEKLELEVRALKEQVHALVTDLENRPAHMEQARTFEWGKDLGGAEETILASRFDKPVVVTRYPAKAKAFYMKADPRDPRVVLNLDVLAPEGYGEIIGGSQREDRLDKLTARMQAEGMDPAPYEWYLDLRRYGSVPHGGFGLGLERTVAWLCGLQHVREAIAFPRLMGRLYP